MTIKSLFESLTTDETMIEFIDILESTQPDFDEETDWDELSDRDQAGTILQFAIISGMKVSDVMEEIWFILKREGLKS